ncbi:hypothetical protein [Hyphomicrobium sp.]|uniref:hypothetical protein n=1 Tax=Hyphomicrobium sp. TaxID=82 RepID=UPI002FE0021E
MANTQQKGVDMARPAGIVRPEVWLSCVCVLRDVTDEVFEQEMKTQINGGPVLHCGSSSSRRQNDFVAKLGITREEISFLLYYA